MMDRRSWLWRRKSSDKSLAETESTGSVSSRSERYSDDQVFTIHNPLSPEVTSKAVPVAEAVNDSEESLTEKLSAALNEINTKEESIKQHAKFAEEAVSGWEKAEKEVSTLKHQLEKASKKNSVLEDKVRHLDGALKECMRQLRQAREEQEQKIHEAVTKKTSEWESKKHELESQLAELKEKLEMTKSAVSVDYDLFRKLEITERENAKLKREILSRDEELEIRILERDLSSQAAETASKQNLESIKKVAKLEAECRRLKAEARKASTVTALKLGTASADGEERKAIEFSTRKVCSLEMARGMSSCSDSLASSLATECDQLKNEKHIERNVTVPILEIELMNDFLEMERLAAMPLSGSRPNSPEAGPSSNQFSDVETQLNAEPKVMVHRTAELEEKLEKKEAERAELLAALIECQRQLEMSRNQLGEAALRLVDVQTQSAIAIESRQASEKELSSMDSKREVAESKLGVAEAKIAMLVSQLDSLEDQVQTERALSAENLKKCQKMEGKLRTSNNQLKESEAKLLELQNQLIVAEDLKQAAVEECNAVHSKRKMAEALLRDAEAEIEGLRLKTSSLEDEVENERSLSAKNIEECQRLESDLEASLSQLKQTEMELVELQNQVTIARKSQEASKKEAEATNTTIEMVQSKLRAAEVEIRTLLTKIDMLEEEVEKEHALSAETSVKYQKLEDEFTKIKYKPQFHHGALHSPVARSNGDLKLKQEKELEEAASKLAACQKTIASLGHQLESLATLDDHLGDSDEHLSLNYQGLPCLQSNKEAWKLDSTESYTLTGSVL